MNETSGAWDFDFETSFALTKKADFQSRFRANMKKPVSAVKFNQYRTMKQSRVMADSQTVKIDLDLTVLE